MKKYLFALILIAAGIAYYLTQHKVEEDIESNVNLKVIKGDFKIEINSYGTLQAKNSLKIKSGLPGTYKITHLIEEGSDVKEGDLLARFEKTNIEKSIEGFENTVLKNRTSYKTNESNYEIGVSEGHDRIEKAELELKKAKMNLEKFINGDQPLEERNFKIIRDESKLKYLRKKERFDQLPKLLEEGFITQIEYETEEMELKSSKIRMESDQLKLDLYIKYTKPQQLLDKQNAVKLETNNIVRVKKQVEARNDQLNTSLIQAKRALNISDEKLAEWQENLTKTTLLSPASGIVIHGDPKRSRGSSKKKVDDMINEHSTLITLPDLKTIEVNSLIHESEIEQIKIDQECTVMVDAADNRSYKAKVSKIATIANTGTWTKGSDVKEFAVTIEISDHYPEVRPGTSAMVIIHVDHIKDTLMIPTYAIRQEDENSFCQVLRGSEVTEVQIKTGKHNISFTEILSGLNEGERILLYE
ncbi:MAG: efflux RND transporter periplasmic adaptor subunit [Planctomycetes bacterium]|nr:efflux RND transporter periplasmic adaptor subunit [Planctomycetota bacterium]